MPRHVSHTQLATSPETAFDYLSTPACWREWHAASLGTVPDSRQPQPKGATFEEQIHTAGFRRRLQWRVRDAQRPLFWEGEAHMDDGSTVRLRYDFAASAGGTTTTLTRTLDYTVKPLWLRVIDMLVGRLRIRRESAVALRKLQARFAAACASCAACRGRNREAGAGSRCAQPCLLHFAVVVRRGLFDLSLDLVDVALDSVGLAGAVP